MILGREAQRLDDAIRALRRGARINEPLLRPWARYFVAIAAEDRSKGKTLGKDDADLLRLIRDFGLLG